MKITLITISVIILALLNLKQAREIKGLKLLVEPIFKQLLKNGEVTLKIDKDDK